MPTSAHTRGRSVVVEGSPFRSFQGLGFTHIPAADVDDASGVGGAVDVFYGSPYAPFNLRIIGAVVTILTEVTGADDSFTIEDGAANPIATLAIPASAAGTVLYFPARDPDGDDEFALMDEFTVQYVDAGTQIVMEYGGTSTAGAYHVALLCTSV